MAWRRKQTCMIHLRRWHVLPHFLVSWISFWNQKLHPSYFSSWNFAERFQQNAEIRHHFGKRAHKHHFLLLQNKWLNLSSFVFFFLRNQSKNPARWLSHLDFRDASFAVKSAWSVALMSPYLYTLPFLCP